MGQNFKKNFKISKVFKVWRPVTFQKWHNLTWNLFQCCLLEREFQFKHQLATQKFMFVPFVSKKPQKIGENTKNADFLNFEPLKKYPNNHRTYFLFDIRNQNIKNYPKKNLRPKKMVLGRYFWVKNKNLD